MHACMHAEERKAPKKSPSVWGNEEEQEGGKGERTMTTCRAADMVNEGKEQKERMFFEWRKRERVE